MQTARAFAPSLAPRSELLHDKDLIERAATVVDGTYIRNPAAVW
jgi:hypothetical protein